MISVFCLIFVFQCIDKGFGSWIDPDTPLDTFIVRPVGKSSTSSSSSSYPEYSLVFSDEFNEDGRRFDDGSDPRWTALDKDDYTNAALQYYNSKLVRTEGGSLRIKTVAEDIHYEGTDPKTGAKKALKKNYQSGMVQGWNKFCFTGGIVEINAKLPGRHNTGGLWPAMWLLGNLARATYIPSSDLMWPWSFSKCDETLRFGQKISGCNKVNHYDLHPYQGRGAPEIDILEAMPGEKILPKSPYNKPYFSSSFQVAPGLDQQIRPQMGESPLKGTWYEHGLEYGNHLNSSLNIYFYGSKLSNPNDRKRDYQADALSANSNLYKDHFDSFHTYRLEWSVGPTGNIKWFVDGDFIYSISADALNVTGSQIPNEPMYLLLNTAISTTWGFPPCPEGCDCSCYDCRDWKCTCSVPHAMCDNLPAEFEIDWVRVYQNKDNDDEIVGCSTPNYPTQKYIEGHKWLYTTTPNAEPLLPIRVGGGVCRHDSQCGHGQCVEGHCACKGKEGTESKEGKEGKGGVDNDYEYIGPNCLASNAFNDIDWEATDALVVSAIYVPLSLQMWTSIAGALLVIVVWLIYHDNKSDRNYMEIN